MAAETNPGMKAIYASDALGISRELGAKVTDAIDKHYESIKPEQGAKPTEEAINQERVALTQRATELDMGGRFAALQDSLDQAKADLVAPSFIAALKEAGVPEGHAAYDLVNDPKTLMSAVSGTVGSWQFGDGVSLDRMGRSSLGGGPTIVYVSPEGRSKWGRITFDEKTQADMKSVGALVRPSGCIAKTTSYENITLACGGVVVGYNGNAHSCLAPPMDQSVRDGIAKAVGEDRIAQFIKDNEGLVEERSKISAMSDEDGSSISKYGNEAGALYRELTFNTIGALRPLASAGDLQVSKVAANTPRGGKLSTAEGAQATRDFISAATTRLPSDWVKAVNSKFPGGIGFTFKDGDGSGKFVYNGTIEIKKVAADPGDVRVGRTALESTLLHEITHACQNSSTTINALETAFISSRGSGTDVRLPGYASNVRGEPDKFNDPYTGRRYGDRGYREVITTGMEGMITPTVVPEATPKDAPFGKDDKDFQNFVTGTMLLADRKKGGN
jgi:hypothetical protein